MGKDIVLFQQSIPHYRLPLIDRIAQEHTLTVYTYGYAQNNLKLQREFVKLTTFKFFEFLIFLIPIESIRADVVILQGDIRHLSNIAILVLRTILLRRTILWTHGISCRRYFLEIQKMRWWRRVYFSIATDIWLYTQDVYDSLPNTLQNKSTVLFNSIERPSYVQDNKRKNSDTLTALISTRWNTPQKLGEYYPKIFECCMEMSFIVIGEGIYSPQNYAKKDFSNVRFVGELYEEDRKDYIDEADFLLHLGWTGLSVVEAFSLGLPVITLERSVKISHSVEYDYLVQGINSMIFGSLDEVIVYLNSLKRSQIERLSKGASSTYESYSFEKFANNILSSL